MKRIEWEQLKTFIRFIDWVNYPANRYAYNCGHIRLYSTEESFQQGLRIRDYQLKIRKEIVDNPETCKFCVGSNACRDCKIEPIENCEICFEMPIKIVVKCSNCSNEIFLDNDWKTLDIRIVCDWIVDNPFTRAIEYRSEVWFACSEQCKHKLFNRHINLERKRTKQWQQLKAAKQALTQTRRVLREQKKQSRLLPA